MNVLFIWWDLDLFHRYHEQIKHIAEFCDEFHIIYYKGSMNPEWLDYYTFHEVPAPDVSRRGLRKQIEILKNNGRMFEEVQHLDIDIVYCLSGFHFQITCNLFAAWYGAKSIMRLRGNDIEAGKSLRSFSSRIFHHFLYFLHFPEHDAIIPISEKVKAVPKFYHVPEGRVTGIIPNGVDVSLFNVVYENAEPVYGFIGRLSKEKGGDIFIDICNYFSNKVFYFAGWDDGLKLPDNVINLGALPKREVSKFYDKIDYVLMPSRTEGFPNTILEAYASGKQVISNEKAISDEIPLFGYGVEDNSLSQYIWVIEEMDKAPPEQHVNPYLRNFVQDYYSWDVYQVKMKEIFYQQYNSIDFIIKKMGEE